MDGSSIVDDNPKYRRIFGKISKFIIQNFATPGIYDTQRGFKLFTKTASDIVFSKQTLDGWGFDIELIVIAQSNNLIIKEVPVQWKNSRASSVKFSSYFKTLLEFFIIKYNYVVGRYI